MKKAIALLATLVVLTSTTFAQLAPSISGSAETKWGIDLDNETNGFELSTDVTVSIPVTSGETVATADAEGVAGKASISGTTLTINLNDLAFDDDAATDVDGFEGAVGDISATIEFGNGAYMTVGSDSGLSADKVSGSTDYIVSPDFGEDAGVSLGLNADAFSVELTVANEADGYEADGNDDAVDETFHVEDATDVVGEDTFTKVDDADETTTYPTSEDGYVLGATASYSAGDIFAIDLAFGTNATGSSTEDANVKTGVAFEITSMPMENVTVTLPMDYLTKDGNTAMELMPTVDVTAGDLTLGVDVHYISVAKDLAPAAVDAVDAVEAVEEVIPEGYSRLTDGYLVNDTTGVVTAEGDVEGYVAPVEAAAAQNAYAGLTEDFVATTLNASLGYTLALGDASLAIALDATDLLEDGREFAPSVTYTADVIEASFATSYSDELGAIEVGLGYTGIENVSVSVDTTLLDGDTSFALDSFKVEYSGVANTAITAEYAGFNTDGDTGSFYVGAKISL